MAKKVEADINDFEKIADFDIHLRREFEASDFANEFILTLVKARHEEDKDIFKTEKIGIKDWRDFGTQHFMAKMNEHFKEKRLEAQRRLIEDLKNNERKLASELRAGTTKENSFFEIDLSDASVRSVINEMGEVGFRAAARKDIHKFFRIDEKAFENSFLRNAMVPYLQRRAEHIEAIGIRDFDKERRELEEKAFEDLPENKVFKTCNRALRNAEPDLSKFLFSKWDLERDKMIKSIKEAADEKAKREAENQLGVLDDFQAWFDNELREKETLLREFLAAEEGKAVREAHEAVLAAERDIPK